MRNLAAIFILLMRISEHPSGLRSMEIFRRNSRQKILEKKTGIFHRKKNKSVR